MKHLYLIGGTMGVGKTTVCRELQTQLHNSVLLDGDLCWCLHPFTVNEETKAMVMDNICHLLNNAGADRLPGDGHVPDLYGGSPAAAYAGGYRPRHPQRRWQRWR